MNNWLLKQIKTCSSPLFRSARTMDGDKGLNNSKLLASSKKKLGPFFSDHLILHLKLYYFFELHDVGVTVFVEWFSPGHYLNLMLQTLMGLF